MKIIKDIFMEEFFRTIVGEFISEFIKLIPEGYRLLVLGACLVVIALMFCFFRCNKKNKPKAKLIIVIFVLYSNQ